MVLANQTSDPPKLEAFLERFQHEKVIEFVLDVQVLLVEDHEVFRDFQIRIQEVFLDLLFGEVVAGSREAELLDGHIDHGELVFDIRVELLGVVRVAVGSDHDRIRVPLVGPELTHVVLANMAVSDEVESVAASPAKYVLVRLFRDADSLEFPGQVLVDLAQVQVVRVIQVLLVLFGVEVSL